MTEPQPVALRPTRTGILLPIVAVLVILLAMDYGNNGLLLTGCVILGCAGAALFAARANVRGLTVRRRIRGPLFARQRFRSKLTIGNPRRSTRAFLELHDRAEGHGVPRVPPSFFSIVATVPGRSSTVVHQESLFFRRGRKRFTHVAVSSGFPFGLFRVSTAVPCDGDVLVHPEPVAIPPGVLPRSEEARGFSFVRPSGRGTEEFAGVRELRPGDSARHIHWRTSARVADRLLVKQYEHTPSTTVQLELDTRLDEPSPRLRGRFERAVQIAASLLRELVRHGHEVRFTIRGAESRTFDARTGHRDLAAALEALALVEPESPIDPPLDTSQPSFPHAELALVLRAEDCALDRPLEEIIRFERRPR